MGPSVRPVLQRWDPAKVSITIDGNSLVSAGSSALVASLAPLAPLNGAFTIKNRGSAGQTTDAMISSAADVDSSFEAGKTNFLLIWEITNSVFGDNLTGLQACERMTAYIAARKAANPWRVVLFTCLPRGTLAEWDPTPKNTQLTAANAYMRANFRAMGAEALVEMQRPGGPFAFTDVNDDANFPPALWEDHTHPTAAGHAYTARYVADVLDNLRARV